MRQDETFKIIVKFFLECFVLLALISSSVVAQNNSSLRNNLFNNENILNNSNNISSISNNASLLNKSTSLNLGEMYSNAILRIPDATMVPPTIIMITKENNNQIDSYFNSNKTNYKTNTKLTNKVKASFNLVSSFRENIRFGGFWDRYAIINFTPTVNVKPLDFISITANQNLSCFVPINGIKEHFKSLFIQGASILIVDNTVKYLFGANEVIPVVTGYAVKNIVLSLLKKVIAKQSKNPIYTFDSYNYSISIKF